MFGSVKEFFDVIMRLILSVQWYDIADIIFVALLLYYAIKMLRQTRAFNLIKGVIFVGVIYMIVSTFNMSATTFLFSRLFSNIFFVMVILFQPEIRHAIESFGRGDLRKISIFTVRGSDEYNDEMRKSASNIARAATIMSEKKIGALMVIEGKTPLGEIISTGTQVDSAVTSPVIENIFFPKAPLHDGAVVIRDNRIHSAGCILPLTQNEVSLELGTRHRAALGMSENSDALVVVVSEETGAISVAHRGVLERDIKLGELTELLTDYLVTEEPEKLRLFGFARRKK
ncbi:MAG: diadenylate cyclase CdaA [Clostridia bacterium]|nr:TIGR00159 family protein [Oscillospiraceae bacterium]MBQ7004875.1 diadenylate cyclase CdaA [Clostridia bacterium]